MPPSPRQYWDADILLTPAATRLHDRDTLTDPYSGNPIDLTLFVSCFNESAYIVPTLETVCAALKETALSYEILVIDDGSTDGSVDAVRQFITAHPGEPILLRANKRNKGWAQNYIDAAFLGRGKYFRATCGDNSQEKEDMLRVLKEIGQADIIVPHCVKFVGRGVLRDFVSRIYTLVINVISGNRLHYYNGSPVHLRHNVMRWHPNTRGYGFQAEILCLLLHQGFTYKEVPVVAIENRKEKSNSLTAKNLLSVGRTLLEIFIRRLSNAVYGR